MKRLGFAGMAASLALFCLPPQDLAADQASHRNLTAFQSEAQLRDYLVRLQRRPRPLAAPMMEAAPPVIGAFNSAQSVAVTADRAAGDGITNNQVAGVDEGDIVKQHGDTLVILRRGRLFTVSLAGGGMQPVDSINAYPPGVDARADWYDEMLVSGSRVIVIGYSYGRGGTEINRFQIDRAGHLTFEDAYQLRSNDYYSARNYASRLIGHQLILYSPRYLSFEGDPLAALPALRRWTGESSTFRPIGSARTVYLAPGLSDTSVDTIHTVTFCDLTAEILACKATSVLGPDGRVFYVSAHAVFVWVTPNWDRNRRAASLLYRLPLDGSAPSAIGVRGAPTDQFSFREDAETLNVLVRSEGAGDAMWTSEFAHGAVGLLRIPLAAFGDGLGEVGRNRYRDLPAPRNDRSFQNRFVGDYVLYGEGNGWNTPQDARAELIAAPVAGGPVTTLRLPHGVDRIEAMGRDAVAIGSDSANVYFSSVMLAPDEQPTLGDRYVLTGAAQSETRSHGFFFKPDAESSADSSGILALPVSRPARPAYHQLFENSAAMVFLRRSGGKFLPLGELAASSDGIVDDSCVASCDDWYGNARPIFVAGRTFALMGYELVEGAMTRTAITETGRVTFESPERRLQERSEK
jgi:hypothetical protein